MDGWIEECSEVQRGTTRAVMVQMWPVKRAYVNLFILIRRRAQQTQTRVRIPNQAGPNQAKAGSTNDIYRTLSQKLLFRFWRLVRIGSDQVFTILYCSVLF